MISHFQSYSKVFRTILFAVFLQNTAHAFTISPSGFQTALVHRQPVLPVISHNRYHSKAPKSLKSPLKRSKSIRKSSSTKTYLSDSDENVAIKNVDDGNDDLIFDGKTTVALIAGQSTLIIASIIAALILRTPNFGLGSNFALSTSTIFQGTLAALPLFGLAAFLDIFEDNFQVLQDVSKATQRSVLGLLGTKRKPLVALVTAIALGLSAGIGEEMLFRGILQSEMALRFGSVAAISVTSIVFGALHAVTPLYAILAAVASVFFGYLFQFAQFNLAVPIVAHALYDVGALLWAHYVVTGLSKEEQMDIYKS